MAARGHRRAGRGAGLIAGLGPGPARPVVLPRDSSTADGRSRPRRESNPSTITRFADGPPHRGRSEVVSRPRLESNHWNRTSGRPPVHAMRRAATHRPCKILERLSAGGGIRTHSAKRPGYSRPRLSNVGAPAWGDWPELNRHIQDHNLALYRAIRASSRRTEPPGWGFCSADGIRTRELRGESPATLATRLRRHACSGLDSNQRLPRCRRGALPG